MGQAELFRTKMSPLNSSSYVRTNLLFRKISLTYNYMYVLWPVSFLGIYLRFFDDFDNIINLVFCDGFDYGLSDEFCFFKGVKVLN